MSPSKSSSKPRRTKRHVRRRARAIARANEANDDEELDDEELDDEELDEDEDEDEDEDGDDEPSYTIDELAALTRVPSRTIRFYQSSGVLPKPQKRGRVAYYSPTHIERLELIGRMQDRGLQMRAIKDLFEQIERGEVVLSEWLGLEEQLSSSWIDDAPALLDRAELDELLGERRPGFIAELARNELLEIQADDAYLVPSPGLLRVALELDEAGISLEVAAGASSILQRHLSTAAAERAQHFAEHAGEGFGQGGSVPAVTDAFRELRGKGLESVRLIFAREMEQVLRKMVETGEAARIDKKKRAKRR